MASLTQFPSNHCVTTATIANGAALTSEIDLGSTILVGIIMPASWTAASLAIKAASASGGTFNGVYAVGGGLYELTVAASKFMAIDPATLRGLRFIKLWSETSGSDVNQGAARDLIIVSRPM